MKDVRVGIGDIALFLPPMRIDLDTIISERIKGNPGLERKMKRALQTTGQKAIRFPDVWEDTATLAAETARKVIMQRKDFDTDSLRYIVAGTETTLDYAKPVASYVLGMLKRGGIPIPNTISTFQTQHACAAGSLALLGVCALIKVTEREGDTGLILSSDISRYKEFSTAELTQGAGAAAVIAESSPGLIELDMGAIGYCSYDVDDFFRPLGQETAEVKGYESIKCYQKTLIEAFLDFCDRSGRTPDRVLLDSDFFALHTPFRNMPEAGMLNLYSRFLDLDDDKARKELDKKGFYDGIDPVSVIGNIYNGSVFLTLACLLKGRYEAMGNGIVGKKVLIISYGSGNTMLIIQGVISQRAPEIIKNWDLEQDIYKCRMADFVDYTRWIEWSRNGKAAHDLQPQTVPEGAFFLRNIREDGYREYGWKNGKHKK